MKLDGDPATRLLETRVCVEEPILSNQNAALYTSLYDVYSVGVKGKYVNFTARQPV